MLKKILFFCVLLFSTNSYSRVENTHIGIYNVSRGLLLKDIKIYDNEQLQGKPAVLTNKQLTQANGKIILFEDYVDCKLDKDKCEGRNLGIDYLKSEFKIIFLVVHEYRSGVATVIDKGKKYYLKIDESYYANNKWPEQIRWKYYFDEDAYNFLENWRKKDSSFDKIKNEMLVCAKKEDPACFEKISHDDHINFVNQFKYRSISDDPVLCAEYRKTFGGEDLEVMDYLISEKKIQSSKKTWEKLLKMLELRKEDINVTVYTYDIEPKKINVVIDLKSAKELPCDNVVDLRIRLSNGDGWNIDSFSSYEEKDFKNP